MKRSILILTSFCTLLTVGAMAQGHEPSFDEVKEEISADVDIPEPEPISKNALYKWDQRRLDWVKVKTKSVLDDWQHLNTPTPQKAPEGQATAMPWTFLEDIHYKLKYFEDFGMDIFAPVFSRDLEKFHGARVLIEGYVIPLELEDGPMALSANPFASCFFCGKASPASVVSLYLEKEKLYKMDDYRKFVGTLYLNEDDPDNYYYILRDAKEVE